MINPVAKHIRQMGHDKIKEEADIKNQNLVFFIRFFSLY